MSVEREFVVNYVVRRAEEQAAQAASVAGYKQIEKQADATAKAVEANATREATARKKAATEALTAEEVAAKAKEELIRRENASKVKALADAQDAEKKAREERKAADKAALEDAKKAAKERSELAKQEAAQRKQEAKEIRDAEIAANKAAAQARRDSRAAERVANKQALTDEAAASKAKEELIRRENAARVKAIADAGDTTKRAGAQSALAATAGSKFLNVLGSIGSAAYGIQGLQSVISAVADSFARAKAEAQEAGKMASDYRATLKGISFLKGENAPTSQIMREDIDFRKQTLQDASNARQVQEAFMNVTGTSVDTDQTRKKMTKADAMAAMVHAGKMQSQYGGSGEAYGSIAGVIPLMSQADRVSGNDVIRQMMQINEIGQRGRATPDQFANQIGAASFLASTGAYKDARRMAAVGSVLSLSNPGEITTGLEQLHKATAGALTNQEKPKGAAMSPADYMKSIGATDQMDDLQILLRMFQDIQKEEVARNVKGEMFSMDTYLAAKGYGDERERKRVSQMYGNRADLKNTMMPLADKLPTLAEAQSPFDQFKQSVQGQKQGADLNEERTRLAMGGGAQEYYQRLEKQAFAAMRGNNETSGNLEDMKSGYFTSRKLEARMIEIIRQEGVAKGLPWGVKEYHTGRAVHRDDPLADLFSGTFGSPGNQASADRMYEIGQRVRGAGGDPMGYNSQIMQDWMKNQERMLDMLDRSERALTGINQKMQPAPVQTVQPGGANAGRAR